MIGDNMVLQRDQQVSIWGWAKVGEAVNVTLNGKEPQQTVTGNDGIWSIVLNAKAAGGPHILSIKTADDQVLVKNIMFGDVWICSGQSNMAFEVKKVTNATEEIKNSNFPLIRLLQVGKKGSQKLEKDIPSGKWEECSPTTIANFSGVAYFFGRDVFNNTKVPIGLINVSWGGSIIEAWLSEEVLVNYPTKLPQVKKITSNPNYISDRVAQLTVSGKDWLKKFYTSTGQIDSTTKLIAPPNADGWKKVTLPGYVDDQETGIKPGISWYKKSFQLTESPNDKKWVISLGSITDVSLIYVNGQRVGESLSRYVDNNLNIPWSLLNKGDNEVLIYAVNEIGKTGFLGEKPLQLKEMGSQKVTLLSGKWLYKQQAVHSGKTLLGARPSVSFENGENLLIYNAMINPLTQVSVKGALWYQGESNANKPDEYDSLLRDLISSWRKAWRFPEMPFYIVQLPNYGLIVEKQKSAAWPRLQEVQKNIAFSTKNSGIAITYDVGEAKNLHPLNKQDVGKRLALIARREIYQEENLVCYGPIFKSAVPLNNTLLISFQPSNSPIVAKNGDKVLNNFKVAGADQVFYPAIAMLDGQTVTVFSAQVPNPVFVRYAFDANPEAVNLYNKAGLPAIPFRTDNLKEW
ncbi:MAG: hypothetical protein EOO42_17695 [Flavobacteriales bacterium]|nr:MAG: hypothetical protein EOO42_17695 [Flavobacteriales bacterium]